MTHKILVLFILLLLPCIVDAQGNTGNLAVKDTGSYDFDTCFLAKTLRIDYSLAGNSVEENAFFMDMKEEPFYGGPRRDLCLQKNTGTYRYCLIDSASGRMLFARGFCSLYEEWSKTAEAKEIRRNFPMAAVMPFPKKTMNFVIEKREYETGLFKKLFGMKINPGNYFIQKDSIHRCKVEILQYKGTPSDHVDVAFLAEGYTEDEMPKFIKDARQMQEYIMSVEPYNNFTDQFNFYAVQSPSDESGVSIPGSEIYVNTNMHSAFYTFDMDRYMTSSDTRSIYDIAANVPFDAIFILVNSKRYGGGGFYNLYAEGTTDNQYSRLVAIHEFGHSFAGLADEYYDAQVTYSAFYNVKLEPWEQNLSTNIDFASKWKSMVPDTVPLPTPRETKYRDVTGLFEGGGYAAKGIYSPSMECRMSSNEAKGFCPVCRKDIIEMIRYYTEGGIKNK